MIPWWYLDDASMMPRWYLDNTFDDTLMILWWCLDDALMIHLMVPSWYLW
jgi:hypothetical protein